MEKINLVKDSDTGKIYLEITHGDLCIVKELTSFQVGKLLMQGEKITDNTPNLYESAKPGYFLFAQKMETKEKHEIKVLLGLFDIFHDLDDHSIQIIFREIPEHFITQMIGVYESLGEIEKRDTFYRNIPKIKRNIIEEDIQNMKSIEVVEFEKTIEKFLEIIYRLSDEGQILLKEKGEIYIH